MVYWKSEVALAHRALQTQQVHSYRYRALIPCLSRIALVFKLHASLASPVYGIINCSFVTSNVHEPSSQYSGEASDSAFSSIFHTVHPCHFEKRWPSLVGTVRRMNLSTATRQENNVIHDPPLTSCCYRVVLTWLGFPV